MKIIDFPAQIMIKSTAIFRCNQKDISESKLRSIEDSLAVFEVPNSCTSIQVTQLVKKRVHTKFCREEEGGGNGVQLLSPNYFNNAGFCALPPSIVTIFANKGRRKGRCFKISMSSRNTIHSRDEWHFLIS